MVFHLISPGLVRSLLMESVTVDLYRENGFLSDAIEDEEIEMGREVLRVSAFLGVKPAKIANDRAYGLMTDYP